MHCYDLYESPHGRILLVASDEGLSGVYFDGQKYHPQLDAAWLHDARHALLRQAKRELAEYFGGERKRFETALAPAGTPFQCTSMEGDLDRRFRRDHYLRRARPTRRISGQRARRGRGDRTQSDRDHRSLPPHRRLERQPDGIRRRSGEKARAARARGRKSGITNHGPPAGRLEIVKDMRASRSR